MKNKDDVCLLEYRMTVYQSNVHICVSIHRCRCNIQTSFKIGYFSVSAYCVKCKSYPKHANVYVISVIKIPETELETVICADMREGNLRVCGLLIDMNSIMSEPHC
jgi:hypothetical protein